MTRIASVDVFVCGFTHLNRSMSALTLHHGNGKFIVHEYYVFGNFHPQAVRCCQAVKADRGRCYGRSFRVREDAVSRNARAPAPLDRVVHPKDQRPLKGKGALPVGSSTCNEGNILLKK